MKVKICYSNLVIYLDIHAVVANGENVILSKKEFQLLVLLARSPNRVFSNDELFQLIWGKVSFADYRRVGY